MESETHTESFYYRAESISLLIRKPSVSLRIEYKSATTLSKIKHCIDSQHCVKSIQIWTRNNSVFGHILRTASGRFYNIDAP